MSFIKDTKVLSKIPSYLVKLKEEVEVIPGSTENIEYIEPNTVNLTASLIDKINEDLGGLDSFNNWTDFNSYIGEFKLDELFPGVESGFYNVTDPELLKGFFAFKGTNIDLQYLLKIAGFTLIIYDPAYYRQAESMFDLLVQRPGDFQAEIQLILDAMTPEEINTGFSQLTPLDVDNVNPIILNPFNEMYIINVLSSIEDLLSSYSVTLSPEALSYIESLYLIQQDSLTQDFSDIDCTITSELFVDLDSPNFTGFRSNVINSQLRSLLRTRLSPCVYLRDSLVFLETKDYYSVPIRVTDPSEFTLTTSIVEEDLLPDEITTISIVTSPIEYLKYLDSDGKKILTNIRHDNIYVIDNLEPYSVKGNNDLPWLEETVEITKVLDVPVIPHWTPIDDGFGNVNPTSYPSNVRGKLKDVQGLASPLVSILGLITNGDVIKFGLDGLPEEIITVDPWTPIDDGFGNVNITSYPTPRYNTYFRITGLVSPLFSVVGTLNNNDTIYFDHALNLTLTILA